MYIKIFPYFFRISFVKAITYRFDFIMSLLEGLSMLAINLVFFAASAYMTGTIDRADNFLLAAVFQIFIGIFYGLFIDNITGLKYYINRGDLDWMLLKPISSQFYISLRFINFGHIIGAVFSIPIVFYITYYFNIEIDVVGAFIGLLYIMIAIIDAYALLTTATSLAIAFTSSGNVSGFVLPLMSLGKYPRRMYGKTVSSFIIILIPALLLCNLSCEALVGNWQIRDLIINIAIMLIHILVTSKVFTSACKYYKSSGS